MFPYQKAQVSFRKLKEIGHEGRNSEVYIVHDEYLNAELVIKEIEKQDTHSIEHFFEEARTLYASNHPNVVQINYACEDETKVYIASPYYKNGSLKSLMATRFLTTREIIRYSTQVLNGLHNVHSKGLIHFDIKPDNILISDRNEALLADFGLTKAIDTYGVAQQQKLYSKQFPPEVFTTQDKTFDYRFDIYQIGLLMYRMCVGDECFDEQFEKYNSWESIAKDIFGKKFPDRTMYPAHIPDQLKRTIEKCLHISPLERFQSAVEIVNAIADIDGTILDWQYSIDEENEVWTHINSPIIQIRVKHEDGSCYACKIDSNGNARKINALCKAKITLNELKKNLKNAK